jgi:hypothetical protein
MEGAHRQHCDIINLPFFVFRDESGLKIVEFFASLSGLWIIISEVI